MLENESFRRVDADPLGVRPGQLVDVITHDILRPVASSEEGHSVAIMGVIASNPAEHAWGGPVHSVGVGIG